MLPALRRRTAAEPAASLRGVLGVRQQEVPESDGPSQRVHRKQRARAESEHIQMSSGHRIRLPRGTPIKGNKIGKRPARMSVSARMKRRKSKRIKPVRRTV